MKKYLVKYKSVKNSYTEKPNEDYLLIDIVNDIYIISDGITRTNFTNDYPNPSPSSTVAEIFSKSVYNFISQFRNNYESEQLLYKAIIDANKNIKEYNNRTFPNVDYLGNDYAGTVFIMGIIQNGFLYYAYVGDCICLAVKNNRVELMTEIQTSKIESYRKKFGFSDEATLNIRKNFRNNPFHPNGFGAITGEPGCIDFIVLDKIELEKFDRIILMSDGLLDILRLKPDVFIKGDINNIIDEAHLVEKELDLRSDDKSIVVLDL